MRAPAERRDSAASTSRNAGSYAMPRNTCTATNATVAAVGGREQRVVGGAEAQLDREADRVALERRAGGAHGLDGVLARDAYSISSKRTSRSEAKMRVGPVDALALGGDRGREAVQARDRAREARARPR